MNVFKAGLGAGVLALALSGCGGDSNDSKPVPFGNAPKAPKEEAPGKNPHGASPHGANPMGGKPMGDEAQPAKLDASGQLAFGNHSISPPKEWQIEKPANQMRLAQIRVPKAEGDKEDGALTIFALRGGVQGNIDRWVDQFGGKDALKNQREVKTAGGASATIVELEGMQEAMGPAGEKLPPQETKMLAAVIISGQEEFQVKFTGSKKTLDANKEAFNKMMESFK
jgi:hypothetical protein